MEQASVLPLEATIVTSPDVSGPERAVHLAAGPRDDQGMLVIAVHGRHSGWVLNAEASAHVRLRHNGRWRAAREEIIPWDPELVRTSNLYTRSGPAVKAVDPVLIRVKYEPLLNGA